MNTVAPYLLLSLLLLGCKETQRQETRNLSPDSPEQREMKDKLQKYQVVNVECITLQEGAFLDRRIGQSCFGEVPPAQARAFLAQPIETSEPLNVTTMPRAPKTTGIRQCQAPQQNIVLCLETHVTEGRTLTPQHLFALALE